MPLDEQIEDMQSSSMSDLDETTSASPAEAKVDDAASSPATGETEQQFDPLSIVRDVVKETRGPEAASPAAAGSEEIGQEDKTDQKKPDDENFTDVPFHKHPRFQHLLRERNTFKEDAGRYHNVVDFLETNGLSAEEAADGLQIMALMKINPAEAWSRLRPTLEKLVVAAGEVLPQDLREKVQQGQLTQEAAQEIARANARVQSMEAERSFQQRQAESRQQRDFAQSLQGAAHDWETDRQAKDPNFAAKHPLIMKEVLYLQATEGKPDTPQGVKAQLKKAYDAVNASFRPPQPTPQPRPAVRPVTGGQVAGSNTPSPRNGNEKTIDIIKNVVGRRAG